MNSRTQMLNTFYGDIDEEARLRASRHGQLEYETGMHYIHRFAKPGAKILEIGAGTGRYSIALAREGYEVTALELVEHNLEILRGNAAGLENLTAVQGDALDLSRFADDRYDEVLLFGPLYHLYEPEDVSASIREAVRVTKPGGVLLSAFLSAHAILYSNYLQGNLAAGLEENFTGEYRAKHFEKQLFTGYDIDEFEDLFAETETRHIATASADSILETAENRKDFAMSDEEFALYRNYHLAVCEKRELLGCANHLLYICEKRG